MQLMLMIMTVIVIVIFEIRFSINYFKINYMSK